MLDSLRSKLIVLKFSRFAETEGIVAIASILARYEIKIDEQLFPTIPGESLLVRLLALPTVDRMYTHLCLAPGT